LNAQIPIVEKFSFVAHNQVCLNEEEIFLTQYRKACDKQAFKVAQKFNLSLDDFITVNGNKNYLLESSKDSDNFHTSNDVMNPHLLEFLVDLNELKDINFDKLTKDELISKLRSLDKDLLSESFNNEYFLRSQLETVIENTSANKINVLEVNESSSIMSPKIINWLTLSSFNMKINYSILHPFVNELPLDSMSHLQTYDWLIEKSKLPPEINNLDLIIVKDCSICQLSSKNCVNLTQLFESLWAAIRENGFVLIVCKDKISFAEEVICKVLDLNYRSSRKREIIEEALKVGFILIGTKTDSFSNTALLFHKVSIEIHLEKQIFIRTSDEFETWIEKLQNQLKSIHLKPEGENIWLIADKPSNGIIGFVSCLRREPNGDRIRCILDFNQSESESDINDQNLLTIIKQNLVMNVIRDQKLGSFKHFTIESNVRPKAAEHCYLNVITRGDLSSLKWFEAQHKYWPLGRKDNELLCYVYYAPLNFRDIMLATGE
jgi:fatty acid synthase